MKTFTYNRSQLVNNNPEIVKANIEALNKLVRRVWFFRYDEVHGCDGYADAKFNDYTGKWEYTQRLNPTSVDAGKICTWLAKVEVNYNESNDMYFIKFEFSAYNTADDKTIEIYNFKNADTVVIGGKFDEFTHGKINLALMDFEETVKDAFYCR